MSVDFPIRFSPSSSGKASRLAFLPLFRELQPHRYKSIAISHLNSLPFALRAPPRPRPRPCLTVRHFLLRHFMHVLRPSFLPMSHLGVADNRRILWPSMSPLPISTLNELILAHSTAP